MNTHQAGKIAAGLLVLLSSLGTQAQSGGSVNPVVIAGLAPDHRPAGAPQLLRQPVGEEMKQQRLRGISKPWPGNVERIAQQGAWYSPMFMPGMNGRYDLRQQHGPAN